MDNMMVSVCVFTYNSEKTILELLESIYLQDYYPIELIISDDSSDDDTVKCIEKWIEKKKKRFTNITINVNEKNLGASANYNKGMMLASGKWIKSIAGDDILLPGCISNYVEYVNLNDKANIVVSDEVVFDEQHEWNLESYILSYTKKVCNMCPEKQYWSLLKKDLQVSPSSFICKDMIDKIGIADTRIRNIDDWSFRLNITKNGYKIYFMDKKTVKYRIGVNSISRKKNMFLSTNFIKERSQIKRLLVYPNIPKYHIVYYWNEKIEELRCFLIIKIGKNKLSFLNMMFNYLTLILMTSTYHKVLNKIEYIITEKRR